MIITSRNILYGLCLALVFGCSGQGAKEQIVEEYIPVTRKLPLEPVYSRVSWSHLPKPIGPRFGGKSPYLEKVYTFDVPSSNLEETLSALAQAMGYEAIFPKGIAKRKVSLVTEGTVYQILDEICKQAKVEAEIDHQKRIIRVVAEETKPRF